MSLANGTLISVCKLDSKQRTPFMAMPYRDISCGEAYVSPRFEKFITHYVSVHRKADPLGPPMIYPRAETGFVFSSQDNGVQRAYFIGPRSETRAGEYVHNGCTYFNVHFTWAGINALLPMAQNELTDKSYDLKDVFPRWADELTDRMFSAASVAEKINVFERFLGEHLDSSKALQNDYIRGLSSMSLGEKYRKYLKFIKNSSYNERHTRRLFLQYAGVSPKRFIQTARCENALSLMAASPNRSLTDIAYALDYCDQTHFIKEFKSIFNTTPSQFIKEFISKKIAARHS